MDRISMEDITFNGGRIEDTNLMQAFILLFEHLDCFEDDCLKEMRSEINALLAVRRKGGLNKAEIVRTQ